MQPTLQNQKLGYREDKETGNVTDREKAGSGWKGSEAGVFLFPSMSILPPGELSLCYALRHPGRSLLP
jgi:hypothetical protein